MIGDPTAPPPSTQASENPSTVTLTAATPLRWVTPELIRPTHNISQCRPTRRPRPQVWFRNGFPTAETGRGSGAGGWLCSPTWARPALGPAPGPAEITQTRTARSAGRESLSKFQIGLGNHLKYRTRSILTIHVYQTKCVMFHGLTLSLYFLPTGFAPLAIKGSWISF